jgi:DNA phosphorothioation-dependent restriction protein DptG
MEYRLNTELFFDDFFVDNGTKFRHTPGKKFKLFPFITQPNSAAVLGLDQLVGRFLCRIEGKKPEPLKVNELVELLKEDTDIQTGQEELFYEVVSHMFFYSDGRLRPLNLQMLEQIPCEESSERRIADYLVDVLGDQTILKSQIENANQHLLSSNNVLERLMLSILPTKADSDDLDVPYFRVTDAVKKPFEADFAYILETQNRTREYLVPLMEFYFFTYTAQACLQLNRFLDGERSVNLPLYFCLEWEKTSQSRQCFTEGWQQLQDAIKVIFAHAVVLEILNQTPNGTFPVDYIELGRIIGEAPELDEQIATQIASLTDCYREAIADCPEMKDLQKVISSQGKVATEIRYLYNSVKVQFENTKRIRAYGSYANKFESYCHKYLKSRGRSGLMLNLSEETLIFLTKICIKNQEQMRLKDVFKAFEDRGVFLDIITKEQVASYYETLNLIEKKSDSGDAKYVKRIL